MNRTFVYQFTLLSAVSLAALQARGQAQEVLAQESAPEIVSDVPQTVQSGTDKTSESTTVKQDPSAATEFLRMHVIDGDPQSLDTAVVSYSAGTSNGVTVDLIGAVHIGETEYYAELNRLFDTYDVLLYELVAPEGTKIPRGGKRNGGFNPLAMLQDGAKNMLGLESQLEQIDYSKQHFVRADMTPSQIADKMSERGDTVITLALDTIANAMRQQNLTSQSDGGNSLYGIDSDLSLVDIMSNPLKMKRVLAAQFSGTGSLDQAMGGALNRLLIEDRNAEALKGLQKQIAAGKKKIGIFYGAAHLEDFEEHLVDDFGLKKTSAKWLAAWDLTHAKEPEISEPIGLLLNMLKALE